MPSEVTCSPAQNTLSLSNAISSLENQQETLHNMLNALESILYGSSKASSTGEKKQNEGFEDRLNALVAASERALNKLDRVISKM